MIYSKLDKKLKKTLKNKEFLMPNIKHKLLSCCHLDNKSTKKIPLVRASDYILTPKDQLLKVVNLVSEDTGGSDHNPVKATFIDNNEKNNSNNSNIILMADTNLGNRKHQGGLAKIWIDGKLGIAIK